MVRLGGVVTTNPKECTHLVTPRIARTIKFLSGISVCSYVVTPRWVEDSGKDGMFRDEQPFLLRDADAEQLFGMKLAVSLSRAKSRKLLDGMGVYATPSVEPPGDSLRDIVTCAGGRLLSHSEVRAALAALAAGGRSDLAPAGLIVLSTGADIKKNYCKEFAEHRISKWKHATLSAILVEGVLFSEVDFVTCTQQCPL